MVWGCISAHGMGDLHICEGTIDVKAYVGNLETYAAVKMTNFPRNSMSISAGQCQASTQVTTVWLCRHRVHVHYWKYMAHYEEENQTTATTDCWAAQFLYAPRRGKHSTCKTTPFDFFSSQTITKCNSKKMWCYPVVNMPLSQLFLSVPQASISKFVYNKQI